MCPSGKLVLGHSMTVRDMTAVHAAAAVQQQRQMGQGQSPCARHAHHGGKGEDGDACMLPGARPAQAALSHPGGGMHPVGQFYRMQGNHRP